MGCGGASRATVAEAVMNASVAGVLTAADEIARAKAEHQAERNRELDGCPFWHCYSSPEMTLEEARDYVLLYINHARTERGVSPLSLDFALNSFAQSCSRQLARDHRAHQYLAAHSEECPACAESQGDPDGIVAAGVHDQLDAVLGAMINEGTGDPRDAPLLAPDRHRIGVGIVNPDGRTFFTIEAAP